MFVTDLFDEIKRSLSEEIYSIKLFPIDFLKTLKKPPKRVKNLQTLETRKVLLYLTKSETSPTPELLKTIRLEVM